MPNVVEKSNLNIIQITYISRTKGNKEIISKTKFYRTVKRQKNCLMASTAF